MGGGNNWTQIDTSVHTWKQVDNPDATQNFIQTNPEFYIRGTVNDSLAETTATSSASIGVFIFIGMVSFVVAMTMTGLIYMCKTQCKFQCCCTCKKNLEKRDVNLIYGEYYYADGRRMATEMEVWLQIVGVKQVRYVIAQKDHQILQLDHERVGSRCPRIVGKSRFLPSGMKIFLQARDTNPDYDSLYTEGGMETRVRDNNPIYV